MSSQAWKYPPTPPPYVNEGCSAIVNPERGVLLIADRTNTRTRPVERDSNVAFAWLAMTFHDRLVAALIDRNSAIPSPKAFRTSEALLEEIANAVKQLDR